jgi:phosphate transport system permease protein
MRIDQLRRQGFFRRRRLVGQMLHGLFFLCAVLTIGLSIGIFAVLFSQSWQFFQHVSVWDFATGTEWTPLFENPQYGILPLLSATLWVAAIALTVAIPLGLVLAIYLSEFASQRLREILKPTLELLQAVPSIIFGYFALVVLTPLAQQWIPELSSFNLLVPSIVLGIMILPYIVSVSEDAMHAIPQEVREGAYAIGMSRWQTALKIIMPGAMSGILAGVILALSRAIGETMIVAIAAGQNPMMVDDPRDGAATITSYILQMSMSDWPQGGLAYQTIFAAGLCLFLLTLLFNVIGALIRRRFKARFE